MKHLTLQFWADLVYALVRFLLCAIFFYAGIVKLNEPQNFAIIIHDFQLVPGPTVMPIAILLPLAEVLAALALFFDIRGALGTIAILLLFFIGILSYAIILGLDVDCGCFGPGDPEFYAYEGLPEALIRDFFMLAVVLFLYIFRYLRDVVVARPDGMMKNYRET